MNTLVWGNVLICSVTSDRMLVPEGIRVDGGAARYAVHEILNSRPLRAFVGPGTSSLSLSVVLSLTRGVSPRAQLDLLRFARDKGEAHALLLYGRNVFPAGSLAVLESIGEEWNQFGPSGPLAITGSLTFAEYAPAPVAKGTSKNTVAKAAVKQVKR